MIMGLFDWFFDWFYGVLYAISKSLYAIIDNLLGCANILCGIDPITYQGREMDFLSFLMANKNITYAFVGSVLVAVFLVFIFGIIAIIRSIGSEKVEKTPAQITVSIAKTLLTFLFIPVAMTITILLTNTLMRILYQTTTGGAQSLGSFLAGAFGQNALRPGQPADFYTISGFDYMDFDLMDKYVDMEDYDYFFSYISSIVIMVSVGLALLMFVDRAISIVILFIFSPISLSTSVIDDGARFKLWRDQFLTKFLTGYGCIIAINIYALIIGAISNDGLKFFDNSILNNFMKIVIIVGGGISMQRMMALVGNLISAGAGSNELRDAALAGSGFRRAMFAPFGATRSAINFVRDAKNTGAGTTIGRALGFKTKRDYDIEKGRVSRGQSSAGSRRSEGEGSGNHKTGLSKSLNNAGAGAAKNAIAGAGKVANAVGNDVGAANNVVNNNNNNNVPGGQGNNMVSNAINNSLKKNHDDGSK